MEIITTGLDLAKNVFQVHGVDAEGKAVVRKALRRTQMLPFFQKRPPCLVGIEACGTSHHWARELIKLGHEVRLMPPAYVKPYVKRGKTDAADAEAICEAVTRPTMRFVPVKSQEQQAALSMHRARDLFVKQRTQLINMMRGLMAEFGIDIPQGINPALEKARATVEGDVLEMPPGARRIVERLSQQALDVHAQVREIERDLLAWQRQSDVATPPYDDPRHRIYRSDRVGGFGRRSTPIPLRSAFRSLAGTDPAAKVQRRQGAARAHHEDRRQVSSQATGGWHDGGGAAREEETGDGRSQPHRFVGSQACAGRHRRLGEQNGEDSLGHHDARRSLP